MSDRRERGRPGLRTNEGEIDREESLRHGNIPKGNLTIHGLAARRITTKITISTLGDHPPDQKNVDYQVRSMQTVYQTDTTAILVDSEAGCVIATSKDGPDAPAISRVHGDNIGSGIRPKEFATYNERERGATVHDVRDNMNHDAGWRGGGGGIKRREGGLCERIKDRIGAAGFAGAANAGLVINTDVANTAAALVQVNFFFVRCYEA
jgi:hypothetical protein